MTERVKYLGCANGWAMGVPEPQESKDHDAAVRRGERHEMESAEIGRGLTMTTCHTCGIAWSTDSSD